MGNRILRFYEFVYTNGWEGSIAWFEGEFHVTVGYNGNLYSYGQEQTLTMALDSCLEGLRKGGI